MDLSGLLGSGGGGLFGGGSGGSSSKTLGSSEAHSTLGDVTINGYNSQFWLPWAALVVGVLALLGALLIANRR